MRTPGVRRPSDRGVGILAKRRGRAPQPRVGIEATINGAADALVSFNRQDFGQVPARFGIALLLPQQALRRLSS